MLEFSNDGWQSEAIRVTFHFFKIVFPLFSKFSLKAVLHILFLNFKTVYIVAKWLSRLD